MIGLAELVQRELRSTMVAFFLGTYGVFTIFLVASAGYEFYNDCNLIENFVGETAKNALVYEQPIILQRSSAEFLHAMATRGSVLTSMDIYLGDAWVANVGGQSAMPLSMTRTFEPIPGKVVRMEVRFTIVPVLVRLLVSLAVVLSLTVLIYVVRARRARQIIRDLIAPIDSEVERLHALSQSKDVAVKHSPAALNSSIRELNRITEAFAAFTKKQSELHELQKRYNIAEAQRLLAFQVAHDIRSPLSALAAVTASGETLASHLDLAKKAISRLDEIAAGLLKKFKEPSKSQGNGAQGAQAIDVVPLIADVLSEKEALHARNKFSFDCNDTSVRAMGNESDFKRILSNLIENAVDASSTGGAISVSCQNLADGVAISVIDSGKGMAPEVLAQAGTLGFTTGKSDSGNGLGLYQAKSKVAEWAGKFEIKSTQGKGTEATLVLRPWQSP